jgi:hypothetical protein
MTRLLDVAIGVTLLYLTLALLVTAVQELLASAFATRARRLYQVLADVVTGTVDDGTSSGKLLIQAIYEHPLVLSLADREANLKGGKPQLFARGLPSYIPSRTFVVALLDVLRGTKNATDAIGAGQLLATARDSVSKVSDPELKRVLMLLVAEAEQLAGTVNERSKLVSERLETWFNDRMARCLRLVQAARAGGFARVRSGRDSRLQCRLDPRR